MDKTVLITGATGMVGFELLKVLLKRNDIQKIVSISRSKTGFTTDQLKEIILPDFMGVSEVILQQKQFDICFYCLGVYQNQVSLDNYYKITCDYQKLLLDALSQTSPECTFVLFSAQGADTTEKSRFAFRKAKGRAENILNKTDFPKKYIFRPGYIHPSGIRSPQGLIYKLIAPISKLLFKLFPSIGITANDLANSMVTVGMNALEQSGTFENNSIKKHIN